MSSIQYFPTGLKCEIVKAGPSGFVIFGASGDLSHRKLIPSLYLLFKKNSIPGNFFIIGFARTKMSDEEFRASAKSALPDVNDNNFFSRFYYINGEYADKNAYNNLKAKIQELDKKYNTQSNIIYSLAVPPSLYGIITEMLVKNGLMKKAQIKNPFQRIMIEKPFGRDYKSAVELNNHLLEYLDDEQIFRVDHYLGKDTVQNILVFRFANSVFEPVWCSECIDHIQINVSEELGVENRAGYFEQTGLIRDMLQNHLLQLVSLVAMEPPNFFEAEAIRDEKVKVIDSIVPFDINKLEDNIIRGQYKKGKYPAYREEKGVNPFSCIETFFAVKLFINNKRWQGVPFYVKAGKRLDKKETCISVILKKPPLNIFTNFIGEKTAANIITFKIQPEQAVSLRFHVKVPGGKNCLAPLNLNFNYQDLFESEEAGDYASVILDCMLGDQALFWRKDSIESAWKLLTPVLEQWVTCDDAKKKSMINFYPAGSAGPEAANELIQKDGREWIEL